MRQFLALSLLSLLLFTANAVAQTDQVSAAVRKQIVEQMIREGELKRSCLDEAGGYDELVYVNYEHYSRLRIPEMVVMEKYGCNIPGSLPHIWIYRKTQKDYQLIYGPVAGDVLKQKTLTNGYYDLIAVQRDGMDKYGNTKYQFDGIRYSQNYSGRPAVTPIRDSRPSIDPPGKQINTVKGYYCGQSTGNRSGAFGFRVGSSVMTFQMNFGQVGGNAKMIRFNIHKLKVGDEFIVKYNAEEFIEAITGTGRRKDIEACKVE